MIILNNASYHKRLDTRSRVGQELPKIVLEFLLIYSSDFNIIWLVWHSCKEYIAHRLFKSVDELRNLLERLLNQSQLVIKCHREVRNKRKTMLQFKCTLA